MRAAKPHRIVLCFLASIVTAVFFPSLSVAQHPEQVREARDYFDRAYGSDNNLLNGRQYYLYYSSNSHPFLHSDQSRPGDLRLGGIFYQGVPINYDLYQQEVILQYISHSGETRYLILNRELLDEFVLDRKVFRKVTVEGKDREYAQVLRANGLRFYLFFSKKLNYTPSVNATPYHYTRMTRQLYLEQNGKVHPVGSRSSLLQRFEPENRPAIRSYLRQQRIRLNKASDMALTGLLQFCSRLEGGEP